MNKRGIALILGFIVIAVLTIFGATVISRSISETRVVKRNTESNQAFWLAEAGIQCALKELKLDYDSDLANCTVSPIGAGRYTVDAPVDIARDGQTYKQITSYGLIPDTDPPRENRTIEALMVKFDNTPNDFYGNAIYTAGGITTQGNSFDVNGNVTYAGNFSGDEDRVNGTVKPDPSIYPLAQLNFDQLRTISQDQGNYHNSTQLNGPFPTSFWYNETAGTPNVVFLEGSLDLSGKTHVAGFFVVGGEVVYNATISGNVNVDGSIYTNGRFTINGGGNQLNVDGGAWSGQLTSLNGNAKVNYNQTVMNAIQSLNITTDVQIVSWREVKNPYNLTE